MHNVKTCICIALILALTACGLGGAFAEEKLSIVCTSFP